MEPIAILEQCQETIINSNALLRIQAPKKRGKTSLLERIEDYARGLNYRTIRIDFQSADSMALQNLDLLLRWISQETCDQLGLTVDIAQDWGRGGSKVSCTRFFANHVLNSSQPPLLFSLDNLELIFTSPHVGDDFGGLLRSWHEKRNGVWGYMRIIISHTWYIESQSIHNSAFNVGRLVRLPELTIEQAQNLVNLHGLQWDMEQTRSLIDLVGLHPFLIRIALYAAATQQTSLDMIVTRGHLADGVFYEHLKGFLRYLERQPELREIMLRVLEGEHPLRFQSDLKERLKDSGLIKLDDDKFVPTNKLYVLYFQKQL